MPFQEQKLTKLYYTIGEVADMFGENVSLVRFWSNEFELLNPKKNKKGNRLFTKEDIQNFKVIYHLVKERGFTLEGAKKKLKENKEDTLQQAEIVERLKSIKAFLLDLKDNL